MQQQGWHIDKGIPLVLVTALCLQAATAIWWASSVETRLNNVQEKQVVAASVQAGIDRRQDDDAQRSEARILAQLDKLNAKMDRVLESRNGR